MKAEVKCRFGKQLVPLQMNFVGANIVLKSPRHADLIAEIKAMERPSKGGWDPTSGTWTVKNSRRNLFTISYLTRSESFMKYRREPKDFIGSLYPQFWNHQRSVYNFIMDRQTCIIAGEMRTGKTLPTLMAANDSLHDDVWIVSTTPAIRGIRRELNKWGCTKNVYLMTYAAFTKTVGSIKDGGSNLPIPGFVVFDEMQKLKTPTSGRTKMAMWLSDAMNDEFGGSQYVVGLSGTPAPKDPSDWWSLAEIIQPGYLRESSQYALKRRLGNMVEKEGMVGNKFWALEPTKEHPTGWIESEVKFLYERLKGLVLVILKKDCFDLPEKEYEVREIKPSKKILLIAKTIARNADNALVARTQLRQLSDGFQYVKEYDEEKNKKVRAETKLLGSPKLEELKLDLEECEDDGRIIIYGAFSSTVDQITEVCLEKGWVVCRVDGRGWKIFGSETVTPELVQEEMDRSTNRGIIDKLAFGAQADSAGTGLELSAASTVIYYTNSDGGDARMQSEDRAHSNNMDKNRALRIIDYCYLPTDYLIRERLLLKKSLQSISLGDLQSCFDNIDYEEVER